MSVWLFLKNVKLETLSDFFIADRQAGFKTLITLGQNNCGHNERRMFVNEMTKAARPSLQGQLCWTKSSRPSLPGQGC
jgi:hypothetical protein